MFLKAVLDVIGAKAFRKFFFVCRSKVAILSHVLIVVKNCCYPVRKLFRTTLPVKIENGFKKNTCYETNSLIYSKTFEMFVTVKLDMKHFSVFNPFLISNTNSLSILHAVNA